MFLISKVTFWRNELTFSSLNFPNDMRASQIYQIVPDPMFLTNEKHFA